MVALYNNAWTEVFKHIDDLQDLRNLSFVNKNFRVLVQNKLQEKAKESVFKIVKEILSNAHANWEKLDHLLKMKDIVDTQKNKKTPLLLVCDHLAVLFNASFTEERKLRYSRVVELAKKILEAGANPNFQGWPSTPLVVVLDQQSLGEEDIQLKTDLVKMLVQHGADPDLVPKDDIYGLEQSPRQMDPDAFK